MPPPGLQPGCWPSCVIGASRNLVTWRRASAASGPSTGWDGRFRATTRALDGLCHLGLQRVAGQRDGIQVYEAAPRRCLLPTRQTRRAPDPAGGPPPCTRVPGQTA